MQALQMHSFKLGPNNLGNHGFYRSYARFNIDFCTPRGCVSQGLVGNFMINIFFRNQKPRNSRPCWTKDLEKLEKMKLHLPVCDALMSSFHLVIQFHLLRFDGISMSFSTIVEHQETLKSQNLHFQKCSNYHSCQKIAIFEWYDT